MLTEKEERILRAIKAYIETNHFAPTVRELTDMVGVYSTATAHRWLKGLEEKGYISRNKAMPRAIRILKYID